MKIDRSEVFRYMLWRKGEPTEDILNLTEKISEEFEKNVMPKYVYKKVSVLVENGKVALDNTVFLSKKLAKHLENAKEGIILAATLGIEADNIIRRQTVSGTLNASIAQAAGAAMIEGFLDEVCYGLEKEYETALLPRFSPGYGDWALASQSEILRMCDAEKRIGITLTESYMMLPTKSVTAVVGFSDLCKIKNNCENCNKKDCEFRK